MAAHRLLDALLVPGHGTAMMIHALGRLWRSGRATQRAFHEDYAFFIRGLLALHTATAEARWLTHAVELARICDELFWVVARGGYFVAQESGDLIARSKLITDGAIPSSNSAMLHNLISLGQATGDHHEQHRTEAMLCAFGSALANTPSAHIHMVHGLELWLRGRA